MTGGKKAGGSSNEATDKSPDGKMMEPVEPTTAEATMAIMQALTLQIGGLLTRLNVQQEINNHRANPATYDADGEGGNDPVHGAWKAVATEEDDGDDGGDFTDPRDWVQ
eukprot:jgi/Tetstr1/464992/TSEL_009723.t1